LLSTHAREATRYEHLAGWRVPGVFYPSRPSFPFIVKRQSNPHPEAACRILQGNSAGPIKHNCLSENNLFKSNILTLLPWLMSLIFAFFYLHKRFKAV